MHRANTRVSSIRDANEGGCCCRVEASPVENGSFNLYQSGCQHVASFLDLVLDDHAEGSDFTDAIIREVQPLKTQVSQLLLRLDRLPLLRCDPAKLEMAEERAGTLRRTLLDPERAHAGRQETTDSHPDRPPDCEHLATWSARRDLAVVLQGDQSLDLNELLERIDLVGDTVQSQAPRLSDETTKSHHSLSNSMLSEISRALSVTSADWASDSLDDDEREVSSFTLEISDICSCESSVTWNDDGGRYVDDDLSTLSNLDDIYF